MSGVAGEGGVRLSGNDGGAGGVGLTGVFWASAEERRLMSREIMTHRRLKDKNAMIIT